MKNVRTTTMPDTVTRAVERRDTRNSITITAPFAFKTHEERAMPDGSTSMRVSGYAAVFDSDSEVMGYGAPFVEQIKRGAFRKALTQKPDVRFVFNHDGFVFARTKNNTLTLTEDARGLLIDAELNDSQQSRDLYACILRGDVDQMSFAFTVAGEQWEYSNSNAPDKRYITEVGDILDVSPVTYPAYPDTSIQCDRGSAQDIETNTTCEIDLVQRDIEGADGEQQDITGTKVSPAPSLKYRLKILELEG